MIASFTRRIDKNSDPILVTFLFTLLQRHGYKVDEKFNEFIISPFDAQSD